MADIKACIFDLDGVIVDTAEFHFLAWRELAKKFDYTLTREVNEKLKGVSRAGSLDILLQESGRTATDEEKQAWMEEKNDRFLAYVDDLRPNDLLPGVKKFLKKLKNKGYKLAIGSSSKNALKILDKLEITGLFEAIIDGNKIEKGKPDPQIFLFGAEALGQHPANCVVFEDAVVGVEAALAAGMYIIGVGEPDVLHRANLVIPGFEGLDTEIFERL